MNHKFKHLFNFFVTMISTANKIIFAFLLQSEKQLALDQIYDDLMEKIRRLEEDRHNVDISWDDWGNDKRHSKVRGPARKKAVTVNGPFIVYMLHEEDILEDWTTIRKALKRSTVVGSSVGTPTTT